jgi:hypothetical protein
MSATAFAIPTFSSAKFVVKGIDAHQMVASLLETHGLEFLSTIPDFCFSVAHTSIGCPDQWINILKDIKSSLLDLKTNYYLARQSKRTQRFAIEETHICESVNNPSLDTIHAPASRKETSLIWHGERSLGLM